MAKKRRANGSGPEPPAKRPAPQLQSNWAKLQSMPKHDKKVSRTEPQPKQHLHQAAPPPSSVVKRQSDVSVPAQPKQRKVPAVQQQASGLTASAILQRTLASGWSLEACSAHKCRCAAWRPQSPSAEDRGGLACADCNHSAAAHVLQPSAAATAAATPTARTLQAAFAALRNARAAAQDAAGAEFTTEGAGGSSSWGAGFAAPPVRSALQQARQQCTGAMF